MIVWSEMIYGVRRKRREYRVFRTLPDPLMDSSLVLLCVLYWWIHFSRSVLLFLFLT